MKKSIFRKILVAASSISLTAALALTAGSAIAQMPELLSPSGVNAGSGTPTKPMAVPNYSKNSIGLSYGSALSAVSPENEPDLILVVATNGLEGYVYKSDLDAANGNEVAKSFSSPEQAVRWQETQGLQDRMIAVYNIDGKTKIGEFIVGGTLSQRQIASSLGK